MLLTLNQVISQITTLGAAHLQIQSTGVGDFAEWQALERAYPLLWVFHETTSIGDRELVYSIRLVCADRVITGEEGDDTAGMEQEVLSDTLLILLDFLAYFQQQHAQSYKVITSASIDPFTERFNDRVAGNSVLIQIRQPFTWDACQIPQTGATIPPTVDGLTLYDFCDPSVIARLTPSQVACLEAEYGITCVDGNIELNGTPVATVPSGGTENIDIVNGGANPVGSWDGTSWVIGNNYTEINGVQVTDQEAEVNASIAVELDGTPSGVWNAGTQTWEVTSDPCLDAILERNATQIKTIASGATFNLITKLDGAANNGTWDGVDTLDFTSAACSPVTFQINAVNKESLSSGTTFNLITKLDGAVNSGSYDAPTDTLSFTSSCPPVPSVSLAVSDATPDFGQTITLTATPTNITPTSYIFFTFDGVAIELIIEQAGAVYNWTADKIGTYDVYVLATDGINNVYALNEITVAIDPDVSAFLLATGITDPVIQGAIEQLVASLKGFSLWAKMSAIYPFVGGTASTHKYNLKDPRDLDAAFRLTFSGGLSHSSNGVLPNGSNGYGQTYLFPNTTLTPSNWHLSYYSRTNNNLSIDFDFGVGDSFGGYSSSLFLRRSNDTAGFDSGNASSNNRITASGQTNSQGFYIGSIRSNTDRIYIKNGTTTIASSNSNNSNILMDSQLLLFAYNQVSFGIPSVSPDFYGSKQCAFASIGDGLTDIESANFYTAVQAFQTALGRQV